MTSNGKLPGHFREATATAIAGGVRRGDSETAGASMLVQSDGLRTLVPRLSTRRPVGLHFRLRSVANHQSRSVENVCGHRVRSDRNALFLPVRAQAKHVTRCASRTKRADNRAGLGRVQGRPDAQGSLCMKDCVKEVTIAPNARIAATRTAISRSRSGRLPDAWFDTARYDVGQMATSVGVSQRYGSVNLIARHADRCHGRTNRSSAGF